MLLISFNKSCLPATAPNATEIERPFYERSQRQFLLAAVLSSHVRF